MTIYTSLKLERLARMELPTPLQVSVKQPNITIECELTMRLRPPHIAVRKTPQLFLIFPPRHQDLRSPPSHPASVILAWTDNSNNETGFKIQRKQGATGTYTQIATPGANATTYTDNDTALLDGTQYYYKVSATNSAGDSPFSNEVNGITTLKSPTALYGHSGVLISNKSYLD